TCSESREDGRSSFLYDQRIDRSFNLLNGYRTDAFGLSKGGASVHRAWIAREIVLHQSCLGLPWPPADGACGPEKDYQGNLERGCHVRRSAVIAYEQPALTDRGDELGNRQ